jgi:pimeloyl-ACP methyl ester carboxylesterase
MIENEVVFNSGEIELAGTLCLPSEAGQFPCVLMVHGSGPVDRNENAPNMEANIFNAIARYLADRGVGSLRYDKRGCGASSGDLTSAGFYDLIQDGLAAHRFLSSQSCVNKEKIFVLGHSEGSMIAPKINLGYPSVAGLILIGVQTKKLEDGLKYQAQMIAKDVKHGKGFMRFLTRAIWKITCYDPVKTQKAIIEKVKLSKKDSFRYMGKTIYAKWLREHLEYDPVYTMFNVKCPILAITGDKDIQVDPEDAVKVSEIAKGEVEYHIVPNLTHILRPDDGPASIFSYKRLLKQDIDPRVLEMINTWLQKKL